jgi:hypothetical protein
MYMRAQFLVRWRAVSRVLASSWAKKERVLV